MPDSSRPFGGAVKTAFAGLRPLGRKGPGTAPDQRDAFRDPDTRWRNQAPDVLA